jgi:glucose/arabinose dehydrogenase
VSPGDGTRRLFIVEQIGVIHIFKNHELLPRPFLDLTSIVVDLGNTRADERGMLGMAFHPLYKTNGRFFVYYMTWVRTRQKDYSLLSRISEFTVSGLNANVANHSSERVVMEIEQPRHNHNGGQLLFGDDGFLYIFLGDGGAAGDPFGLIGNGQNRLTQLFATLLIRYVNNVFKKIFCLGVICLDLCFVLMLIHSVAHMDTLCRGVILLWVFQI